MGCIFILLDTLNFFGLFISNDTLFKVGVLFYYGAFALHGLLFFLPDTLSCYGLLKLDGTLFIDGVLFNFGICMVSK